MNNRRVAEDVVKTLDPDKVLQKNTRHVYKSSLVRVLDSITADVASQRSERMENDLDNALFSHWCDCHCALFKGLKLQLTESGAIQEPGAELECTCAPDAAFCTDYQHEYRIQVRMRKGQTTVVNLDYVFSQEQPAPDDGSVWFGNWECTPKKQFVRMDQFPGAKPADVWAAIRLFVEKFAEQNVENYFKRPAGREKSPVRK
jgi:hypothetical protein